MPSTTEAMAETNEKKYSYPYVAEFYDGKSVFMTGAAGYLGVVILETLLELCPGIKSIYILLREKKGVPPEKRKDGMFGRTIFDKLKKERPEVLRKVHVVIGDVSKPDLGMNDEDLEEVADNATIVFHCAASTNFLKPFKFLLQQNVLGTQYAVDVSRKLKKLEAFVYTSTAYSNNNRLTPIRETIYRLPFPAQTFIDEIREGTDESLKRLVADVDYPPWPNSYVFSKNLTENFLQDNASDLPVIIIRPSIIGSVWKRPLPGYVEETSGLTALSIAVGKGFLKVLRGNPENIFDFVTCDLTAGIHVAAAWSIGTGRSPPLHVINCTSSVQMSAKDFCSSMIKLGKRRPLPNTFRSITTVRITANPVLYWAWVAYEHYIPAYMFDVLLKQSGSKIRLTRIYQFAEKAMTSLTYFLVNSWHFHQENFYSLIKQLQIEDIKNFELEETRGDGTVIAGYLPEGAPFYQWSKDKKTLAVRMKDANQRHWITRGFQIVFLVCFFSLLFLIFTVILKSIN